MAEEANPPASVDVINTTEEATRSTGAVEEPVVAEAKSAEDGGAATSDVAEGKQSLLVHCPEAS